MKIEEIIEEIKNLDDLLKEAVRASIYNGGVSPAFLQRKFAIGYTRASKLIDYMLCFGFVNPRNGEKMCKIIITPELFEEIFGEKFETKKD